MEKIINQEEWDVIVIGAGPAGSIAAFELSKSGVSTLLIDKAKFPRTKVCGSCLNLRSLSLLRQSGINDIESRLRAPRINKFYFGANQKHVSLSFSGCSVSREKFDHLLVSEAVNEGTYFLPKTRATLGKTNEFFATVHLMSGEQNQKIKAQIVLIADGLAGNALKGDENFRVKPKSRIGVSTIVNEGPAFYRVGTIYMAYSKNGYVGVVRLEDDRIDIAAALDQKLIRSGIKESIASILKEAAFPEIESMKNTPWLGTPYMSRSRNLVSGERFFVIGDAASYTEPFTGEGISWALQSGIAVAPIAIEALKQWSPTHSRKWHLRYHDLIARQQRISKLVMNSLRSPLFIRLIMNLLYKVPALAFPVIKGIEN